MKIFFYRLIPAVLLVAAVIGSFSLPRRDLRSIAQVAGIALDQENGMLRATFELYVPVLEKSIGTQRETVSALGGSLEECVENIRKVRGEELFTDDAAVLILSSEQDDYLVEKVLEHYRQLKNDQMELPVFFAFGQSAASIFEGEGAVISTELAESGEKLSAIQTVKDLMNGAGERVLIRGEGGYEIIS